MNDIFVVTNFKIYYNFVKMRLEQCVITDDFNGNHAGKVGIL